MNVLALIQYRMDSNRATSSLVLEENYAETESTDPLSLTNSLSVGWVVSLTYFFLAEQLRA